MAGVFIYKFLAHKKWTTFSPQSGRLHPKKNKKFVKSMKMTSL